MTHGHDTGRGQAYAAWAGTFARVLLLSCGIAALGPTTENFLLLSFRNVHVNNIRKRFTSKG